MLLTSNWPSLTEPGQVCDSVDAVRRRFKLSQRFTCLRHFFKAQSRPIERHYEGTRRMDSHSFEHNTCVCVHVNYVRVPITSGSGDI